MIVTTGQIIRIESGDFTFERNSDTPGLVTVHRRCRGSDPTRIMTILTGEAEDFIAALNVAVEEDIAYRKRELKK